MPDKKYLIEIPGMPEGSGVWDADKWERNKDLFMQDYPEANVFELGEYDANDAKETDQIMLDLGVEEMSGFWDNAKWERNKDLFMQDHPDAKVSRVRYVDYWGQKAEENRAEKARLQQPNEERNAKLAELGYYDDITGGQVDFGFNAPSVIGLKPLSSAVEDSVSGVTTYRDPRVQEFFANDTAQTERQAEIARLDAEYDANPSVIAQKEWEAQQRAERAAYAQKLTDKIKADLQSDVDPRKAAEGERAKYAHYGVGGTYLADVSDVAENTKKERYATALKFMEKAKIARDSAGKGFWAGVGDNMTEGALDAFTQGDIEAYNEIGDILTRLESELGSLKEENLTEEVFDKYLTQDEQALIKAFYEYNVAMADAQQDMTTAYKGGKIFAESVPFMLEFLATGGIYRSAGRAATSWMGKQFAKWIAKSAAKTLARTAKVATTKIVSGALYAGAGTLARTIASPGTYKRMAEASIEIDDEGHLHRAKSSAISFADSYVENLSEISGGLLGKGLSIVGKGLGKLGKGAAKLIDKGASRWLGKTPFATMGKVIGDNATMQTIASGIKDFMPKLEALGFHGLPEEIGEEFIGNTIREITHIQPGALKEMVSDDNFGAMLIGFAPMTMIGVAGGAISLGVVNAKAAKLGRDLREKFSAAYSSEEIDHMMGVIQNAETAEDIQRALKPMAIAVADSLEKGIISSEEAAEQVEMLYQYGGFVAQNKALLFGNKSQDEQLMSAKREEFTNQYGRFWQEDQSETVQIATLNNGSTVFVTSAPAEDGKITIIDAVTGKKGFANVSDIETKEVDGEQISSSNSMTMEAFLNSQIAMQRKTAEETRMTNERNAQIQALSAEIGPGTKINLGTEGSPVIVFAKRTTKDGVVVVDQTGMETLLGWEKVADSLGKPIIVETDKQKLDAEISTRLQRMAERRMQRRPSPATQATEEAAEGAAEVVAQEQTHIPMNEDGTVNEAAFWTQDPEGYVKWNDEQNQDGGQDSLRQIAISKRELLGMLNEAATGQNTSNPTMRKAAEKQVAAIAEKIARLEALEMSYAEALAEEKEAIKQTQATPTSTMSEQDLEQMDKQYQSILGKTRIQSERVRVMQEYLDKLAENSAPIRVLTKDNYEDVMRAEGCPEDDIKRVGKALKRARGGQVAGFASNGITFVMANTIADINSARITYIHERQHLLNSQHPEVVTQFAAALGDKENALRILEKFVGKNGLEEYKNDSIVKLADEIICRSMEIVYSTENYSVDLQNQGLSEEAINIIKTIDNGQRIDKSLSSARRTSHANGSGRENIEENGRNSEQVSGGILGEQETGSFGSSGRGDGLGGPGIAGEGAEVNPSFVEAISTDEQDAEFSQLLDDKAFETPRAEDGFEPDDVRFSLVKEPELRQNTQGYYDKHYKGGKLSASDRKRVPLNITHFTQELLDAANAQIQELWEHMRPYLDMENKGKRFLPAEVYGLSTLFDNASYGKTMENTLICTRTLAYIDFVEEVKKRIGRPLTATESFLASQMLYDIAIDPQCLYCYVSLDRKAYDEFLLRYAQQRDEVISKWNESDKSAEAKDALYKEFLNGRKPTAQMQARFESWLLLADNGGSITLEDLATKARRGDIKIGEISEEWAKASEKYKKLKGDKKLAYAASEEYQNALWSYLASPVGQVTDAEAYAQSASWAKKEEDYRSYTGELLKCSADALRGLMGHYGLRFYSFSEYSPAFILENMQMVRDAAARGLKGFAYTKEIDFIKIFAPTGMNINCSVYGRVDSEGNVVPDTKQGADWEQVQALREQYPNVGAVFVATNDSMVEWALNQPWIDVIIPFHIVRTGADIAKFYDWTNYSSMQADITAEGKSKYIFPHEHHNDKETFLALAAERGYKPRFADVKLSDGRSIVEHPNYMRLVNETRRSVDETPILTPTFNTEAAKESFDTFVAKGGYYSGYFVDENAFEEGIETVVEDIKAGKTAKDVDYGRQDVPIDVAKIMAKRAEIERKHGKPIDLVEEAKKAVENEVMMRVIGEVGAKRMDDAVEATTFMNNLEVAREMEAAGKDAAAIKMATGWERGADRKWRIEMEDFEFKAKPGKKKTFKLSDLVADMALFTAYPEFKDLKVRYTNLPAGTNGKVTTEKGQPIILLSNELYRAENPVYTQAIEDFMKKYPETAERVLTGDIRNLTEEDKKIFRDELATMMMTQPRFIEEMGGKSTLAHEIQHMIQRAEGFARGGSESMINTTDPKVREEIKTLQRLVKLEDDLSADFAKECNYYIREGKAAQAEGDFDKAAEYHDKFEKAFAQYKHHNQNITFLNKEINSYSKLGEEGYLKLAGEVEARNVSRRLNMSAEERRNTLLSETEDVARDEQIFLIDNIMMNANEYQASQDLVPGHKKGQPMLSDAEMMADVSFRITKNTKATIEKWFNKAGVDAEMTEATINYLDYAFEDTTEQLCAAKWYLNGKISLPDEDEYKVRDAVKVAKQNKVDALSYASPMDILNTFGQPKSKVKPIDPDTVKEFSNKKELAEGIVVYDVQDDFEGQAAVRKIIDTHWGEDANPWCLAARTNGDLERAKDMWLHYSKYPKRIAFRNGKLLAFYASANDKTWWDRNDEPHTNIPYSVKSKEGEYEVSTNYELKEGNKKAKKVSVGKSDKKGRTAYFVGNRLESAGIQDGERNLFYSSFAAGATLSDSTYGVGRSIEIQYGPYKNVTQISFERRAKDEPSYYVRVGYGQNGVRAIYFVEGARGWDIRYGINGDQIFVGRAQLNFDLTNELSNVYSGAYHMYRINDEEYEIARGTKKVGIVKKGEKVTMQMLEAFGEDGAPVGALLDFINDMGWDRADYPYPNPMDADLLRRDDEVREQIRKVENEINEIAGGRYLSSVPAIRFRITPEMKEIKKQAEKDGTFMKAPNGADTNLTPEQWAMVRTKAFKAWFGDWEKDPENASKVVDENGEPMVVYHGTQRSPYNYNSETGEFEKKTKKELKIVPFGIFKAHGEGMFFSEDKDLAKRYARGRKGSTYISYIYECFLNIRHPDYINADDSYKTLNPDGTGWIGADNVLYQRGLRNGGRANTRARAIQFGYDGFILGNHSWRDVLEDIRQYVAFFPSQIKSATDNTGEFSNEDNDIRFRITPEQDKAYMDAVKAGDMETAQRMVIEAAKLAMPNTKVVDENGNPKIVYHGTGSEFYTFRDTSDSNELGAGYYFSDSYEMAERYATDETLADNRFRAEALAFEIFTDEMGHSEEDYDDNEFIDDYNKSYDLAVERLFGNGHVKSVFLNLENPRILSRVSPDFDPTYRYGFNHYNEGVMAKRFNDGVIDEMFTERHEGLTGNQYVAFFPSQIKSADPVTYDDAGNVIPLSERFNSENDDIRFRVLDTAKAELKEKPIKLNGMYRFNLKNAFKGVKDNGGSYPYIKVQLEEVPEDYSGEKITYNGMLEGFAVVRVPKGLITEGEKDNEFFIDPKAIENELWDVLRATENYYEFKHGSAPYQRDWLNAEGVRFRIANENQAIFVSNAAKSVEGIKQEKATPEQWLKMIEKNGGLKAGEDKWMGLSDWLKSSDKKTLTKEEVLAFINENMIVIEEQHYSNEEMGKASVKILNEKYQGWEDAFSFEWDGYMEEPSADISDYEAAVELYNKHHDDKVALDEDGEFEDMDTYEKVRQFGVELSEIYHGSESEVRPIDGTREQYTTQGLQHLHEIALTVPTIESWGLGGSNTVHFEDAGDGRAVAWIRFGDASKWVPEQREDGKKGRTKKVLVIDEIQSKRHQEGREKGYKDETKVAAIKSQIDALLAEQEQIAKDILHKQGYIYHDEEGGKFSEKEEYDALTGRIGSQEQMARQKEIDNELYRLNHELRNRRDGIPYAPFDKNWHELAMKRMLRYAAENGYDVIAWTKGEQQADRYNLGKIYNEIEREDNPNIEGRTFSFSGGNYDKVTVNEDGVVVDSTIEEAKGKPLSDLVGKDLAVKMMSLENYDTIDGEELRIGGEGMKGFYDRMLPAFVNKYGKKWGVKVEDIHLNLEGGLDMHSVPVTEEMKASVMEGQVMFRITQNPLNAPLTAEERAKINEFFPGFSENNSDIRPSMNSLGQELTPDQQIFFANSKAVDKDGNLLVLYHGTPRAGFTEFKSGWFTTSKEDAISYSGDRKGRLFDPDEKYEPETLTAGDFRLGYMTFDSEEDRAAFLERFPYADEVMSEREYEDARMGAEDEEYDALTARRKEFAEVWNAYREYERERFVDTTVGDLIANPEAYTEEDLMRAMLEYDSNASLDSLDDMSTEERKDALVSALQTANEETEGGILDMVIPTRVPRNGEGLKHNDLGNRTYEVYANVENPYEIDANGRGSEFESGDIYKAVGEALADEQYDGVIIRNWRVGRTQQLGDVVVPKDGSQIKLTSNESPTESSDIRFRTSLELDNEFGDAWRNQQNEDGRHSTQVANTKSTYEKIGHYLEDAGMKGATILDASSGLGLGTQALREMGFQVDDVEPFPSENREAPTFSSYADIDGKYDVVISNAVLNVIPDDWRADVLHQMADAVKEGGKMIINTRPASNIAQQGVEGKTRITLDSPSEILVKRGDRIAAYQKGFTSEELAEWIKSELGEGWRVEKATKKNSGISGEGTAVVIKEGDNVSFRTTGTPTDEVVTNGLQLTPAQTAEVAANIFAALPEESRKKITEGLNGNLLGLQDAILQIPTSLATKEEWNEEDKEMAAVVRSVVQNLVDANPTSRPLTTKEALWMLYKATNATNDLIDAARNAFVANRLGFDPASMQRKQDVENYVRFRAAANNAIDAATDMYNYETSLWTERLKESWLDMNQSVISLQNAMEQASGMPIEPWENIVWALNRLSSKSYADKKKYLRDFLMPLWDAVMDIVKNSRRSIESIERYMMLKHGLERNRIFAVRDAKAFYRDMYNVVAERMKNQSHAEQVVALSEAKKALADIQAQMANAQGKKLDKLKEAEKKALMDVEIADLVLRGDEKKNADDLKAKYDAIDAGTDQKYLEFREKDYGGLTSMFIDTYDVKRSSYKSEEAYQKAVLAAAKPRFKDIASMEAAAQQEVADFENNVDTSNLWDKVNAATKETLRHQYESGMITIEQYDSVRDMFKYYVPLRGFADNTAEDMYSYYMNNTSTGFSKPLISAKGRKTRSESPLGWIGTMAESAIQADNKNEAKMCLYYAALRRPDLGLLSITETWFEKTTDANGKVVYKPVYPPRTDKALSADELRQHMDAWEDDMKKKQARGEAFKGSQRLDLRGSVIFQDTKEDQEHIVRVKVAGQDYSIIINGNPRAAQAINGLLNPDANVGPVGQWIGEVRRNLSALLTSYSPLFWVANYQRDLLSSFQRVSEADGWDMAMKYLANRRKAWRVVSYVYKYETGELGDSYYENLYKEFAENGGITGYTALTTNKEYEKLLADYADSIDKTVLNAVKGAWDKFMGFGEAIEQVTRFAAYITAREAGKSIEEAVNAAKEVSVNFNRKGSAKPISLDELEKLRTKDGKKLNKALKGAALILSAMPGPMKHAYFFVNASIQALSSKVKLMKKSPATASVWIGLYIGTSIAMAMINNLLSDGDDDEYMDFPDYLRHSTLLVKVADGYYLKWSLPQEMRPFYAWADILVRKMMGKDEHKNGFDTAIDMGLAASQWLPVNPFDAEDPLLSIVPDFLAPLAELKANQNAFGGKIYDDMQYKSKGVAEEIPAYRKATEKTGKIYVDMAEFLNDLSGGNEVEKGWANINPAMIEHLVEGYGGGIYEFAKMMVSVPSLIFGDEPFEVKKVPFVNKVVLSVDETNMYSHTNEAFYHYRDIADNAKRVEKEYRESDDPSRADAYRQEEDWRVYLLYKEYEKDFNDVKERLNNVADKEEEALLKQEQNVLREMFLNDIAKGDIPEITFQIREDVKRIDKQIKEVMKPVTEANKERLERRKVGDIDGMIRAIDIRDSLKETPEYQRASEIKNDLNVIKQQLKELGSVSRGAQRDSVIGELQKNYDALIKKMKEDQISEL